MNSKTKTQKLSNLTDTQILKLRVPHTYDDFSAMRRIHELSDYLELTPKDALAVIQQMRAFYDIHKYVSSTDKTFYLFVLRWMCRGLTIDQAMRKSYLDHCAKRQYFTRQTRRRRYAKA